MNKEQTNKEFSKKFSHDNPNGLALVLISENSNTVSQEPAHEKVLDFIHQQIEKVIDELVGEVEVLEVPKDHYTTADANYNSGWNDVREELIQKAQEMGYKINIK